MTFDFLHAVDWIVPDPVPVARRFAAVFGLPEVRDDWIQELPSHGYDAVFSRVGRRLPTAPTRLEFIDARPVAGSGGDCSVAPLAEVARWQHRRPQRTHATVLCVSDLDAAVDELRSVGIPVWVEHGCEHLPHRRAWIGWTEGGALYVPGHDGGLLLEMIPTAALGDAMVEAVRTGDSASPRVGRRVHIVADLDAVMRSFATVGLTPSAVVDDRNLGGRAATYRFAHPGSAWLEILQPIGSGIAWDEYQMWGEGPLLTGLLVEDVDTAIATAKRAGAAVTTIGPEGIVVVRDELLPGMAIQLSKNN